MVDEEKVVAERTVALHDNHEMHVTISQHASEEFWRVEVVSPRTARGHRTTTLLNGDSFMMNLIEDAVSGKNLAWLHLAQWGLSTRTA